MRRALWGAVGVLGAIVAMVPLPSASARLPSLRPHGQQPQAPANAYQQDRARAEAHHRLEEMKVELALLSDSVTFPYYLGGRAVGDYLELRGYVPNAAVQKRALDIARRNTVLTVVDSLKTESNMKYRSSPRPARLLQQEGAELLQRNLGEMANPMSLGVHKHGVIVVAGPIDSLESKLAVSRLFRPLSGCAAVTNELTVQQNVRNGERVVQVTHDGSLVVPSSALGLAPNPTLTYPPAPAMPTPVMPSVAMASTPFLTNPTRDPFTQSNPYPTAARPRSSRDEAKMPKPGRTPKPPETSRLSSKTAVPSKQGGLDGAKVDPLMPSAVATKLNPEKKDGLSNALTTPRLPVKWGQSGGGLGSQEDKTKSATASASRSSGEDAKMPTPGRKPKPPAETKKPHSALAESEGTKASKKDSSPFAANRVAKTPAMTWKRPGGEEGSEPKALSTSKPAKEQPDAPEKPKATASASQSHRWPPAYAPKNEGRPGIIVFDEDPPPSQPAPAMRGASPLVLPTQLQHQVQSICGHKARAVAVEAQRDGTMLVKVKVTTPSVEDELTRKILALPEMTFPKVRLLMDVSP